MRQCSNPSHRHLHCGQCGMQGRLFFWDAGYFVPIAVQVEMFVHLAVDHYEWLCAQSNRDEVDEFVQADQAGRVEMCQRVNRNYCGNVEMPTQRGTFN